ncbi:MAG: 4'-phosphopantetheinyl transferase superfamily protein [Acidimicrobiales bacterium]
MVRAAGQMRVGHFAAGRACAHAAMEQLGISEAPLLPGPKRRPVWPDGIDGSITHTDGLCIAVVARSDALAGRSLGIDTEHRGRVKPELFRRLFTNAEIAELEALAVADQQLSATIGFCSKEAVYKAQFPITESWVSFTDVGVTLAAGRARAEANPATDLAALAKVRWPMALGIEIRDEHVVAGALAASAAINTAFNPS